MAISASNGTDILSGFFVGNSFALLSNKEREVRQGHNYYMSTLCLWIQWNALTNVITKVADAFFKPLKSFQNNPLCTITPALLTIPVGAFVALVKQGDYTKATSYINGKKILPFTLPEQVGNYSRLFADFVARHGSKILQVAIVTGAVALIALGQNFYGGALLAALAYNVLDQNGFVPRKISLFVETYMPALSSAGMILLSSLPNKIINAIQLPCYLCPSLDYFIQQKIDLLAHRYLGVQGPTLEEYEAPLVQKKNLTFAQMNEIVDAPLAKKRNPTLAKMNEEVYGEDRAYEINPAHLTKYVVDLSKLPSRDDFDAFLPLFDSIDWAQQYENHLRPKLREDERFIRFMRLRFEHLSHEEITQTFDACILQLATEAKVSVNHYAATWLRDQMRLLISGFMGRRRVEGTQADLDDAIHFAGKTLAFLATLKEAKDQNEKQDILLKLAVEGGGYCSRGLKRTAGELLNNVMQRLSPVGENLDAIQLYERGLLQGLQDDRYQLMNRVYAEHLKNLKNIPQAIQLDVHSYDLWRIYFSLGFSPLTPYERSQVNIIALYWWETYAELRKAMLREYNPYEAIKRIGNVHFGLYLDGLINTSQQLSSLEKEQLIEKFTENNGKRWDTDDTLRRFQRLVLVMLGVLRKKAA